MSKVFSPLPVANWPAADAARWADAKADGKLFDGGGASDWRDATVTGTERGYGIYLTWLFRNGLLKVAETIERRVTPERLERFVTEYHVGRASLTVAGAVRDVAMMLRACSPPDGAVWLSKLAWSMMNSAKPVRPKLPRLASPDELLELAEQLMLAGRETCEAGEKGRLLYRNGLMIACLTTRPMRLGEFTALRLGSTLIRQENGWLIDIPPGFTKKGRRRRQLFPVFLTEAMDFYVDHIRLKLPCKHPVTSDALWLGRDGPLNPTSLSTIIGSVTVAGLGKRVSPHLFRDSAATAIALHIPEQIGISKSVLGHATLQSSQQYYNQAKAFSASAELADVILKIRNGH